MSHEHTTRPITDVDQIANTYFDEEVALSPMGATYLGVPGDETALDDFSPEGLAAMAALRQRTLAKLADANPADEVDRVTIDAMTERLGLAEEIHAAGLDEMSLNVIASPMQEIQMIFDLMPTNTADQWATVAERMGAVPGALDSWLVSLRSAAQRGDVAAQRQIRACIQQAEDLTAPDGYFATFLANARVGDEPLPESVQADLTRGVEAAARAYRDLPTHFAELLERAPEADAVGRERYQLFSRSFLGSTVDLEETYAWGQEELARITAEMAEVAQQGHPGRTIAEAIHAFDHDSAYQLHGTEALRVWMQAKADEAIDLLADTHFDIPGPVRHIECMIAPTQTGGIYYTGPSEDFSRPGRMWWSVPKGVTAFGTWRELTTVYHEGVPGHHLQIGQTVYRRELLNKWRRMASWTSGHGEGWALYAERLMAELGLMDDPGNRMGLLDGQSIRAARVVLDIGIHCGFDAPSEVGGGPWNYDKAWSFLTAHANMDEAFLRFELDRYLGWPGQAPSYKIGERLWMQLRDEVAEREGADFDLKAFHRRALDIGGVGLDTLRSAVLR
ncbi:DUF885 domain-containing protein [Janibacter sp. GXQ6167]|uniref:DUF885 domain-containing protein n=1 Tax=Janibacter sp. GXQ6167 TaxID=3240791 RepID=UPI00352464CF